MSVLKPCPFCGGLAELVEGEECAYVQCINVKMHRAMFIDGDNLAADEAVAEWNRRALIDTPALPTPAEPAGDALREALEQIAWEAEAPQQFYDRYGPQWTSKHGNEYEDTSSYLAKCNDIAAIARAALAAAPQPAPAVGWRPWGTAPEDGTEVLVYRPDAGVFMAHFVEEDAHLASPLNPPEGDVFWFSTTGDDLTSDLPTHWRPLPAGPEAPQPAPNMRPPGHFGDEYDPEACPDEPPSDREALVEVILDAMLGLYPGRGMARAIADALLARGLRLPTDAQPETLAWAVIEDGQIHPRNIWPTEKSAVARAKILGTDAVRVAIRIVEDEA